MLVSTLKQKTDRGSVFCLVVRAPGLEHYPVGDCTQSHVQYTFRIFSKQSFSKIYSRSSSPVARQAVALLAPQIFENSICARARTRTWDHRGISSALYQLSYARMYGRFYHGILK